LFLKEKDLREGGSWWKEGYRIAGGRKEGNCLLVDPRCNSLEEARCNMQDVHAAALAAAHVGRGWSSLGCKGTGLRTESWWRSP
jgi:hypothetical protein